MPPKHRQLRTPRPKASGNAFQALVDPPHDGNDLSLDGVDERTKGSDDNTIVNARPRDSGPPASLPHPDGLLPACANIEDRLEHLLDISMKIGYSIRANSDYITEQLGTIDDNIGTIDDNIGTIDANNDDRFEALSNKMDSLLQKMDAAWTENTALSEAYRASREETAALRAAVDTLTKKLDENIAISAPPSPATVTTSTTMEEMTMQLSHVKNDIQDVLDAVCNPPGKRKQRTSGQDNEPMTPTNR
jgi:hypothetical protein